MPLDVLGRTRVTMAGSKSISWPGKVQGNLINTSRVRDSSLEFWILNEEFLVSASHQLALIMSLPFVHTARHL